MKTQENVNMASQPPSTNSQTFRYGENERNQIINDYIQAGYALIPLYGKIPSVPEWTKTLPDPTLDHTDFPENFGIALQEDDLIIDVDPRNFKKDDNPLDRLIDIIGPLSGCFMVKTGGGGVHLYLKKPPELNIVKELPKLFKGIEYKSKGQQVVGASSIHPETEQTYRILCGSIFEPVQAPQSLLDIIKRPHIALEDDSELTHFSDDIGTIDRYIRYLQSAPEAVQGAQGDLTTYKIACIGRDMGLSPQMTFETMDEHWNMKCSPPWTMDELKTKITNAYKYGRLKMGNAHPEMDFQIQKNDPEDRVQAEINAGVAWNWKIGTRINLQNDLENTHNYFKLADHKTYRNPLYNILRLNEFTGRIEFVYNAPWHSESLSHKYLTDADLIEMKYWLSKHQFYRTNIETIAQACTKLAQENKYHPIKGYLERVKWDGVPRLDKILVDYAGAEDTPYTRAVGKCVIIAAIARIYIPGCKFDHMLVLEGPQGTGKSTFVDILGGEFSLSVHLDPHSKDTKDAIQGGWIIEIPEMEFTKRVDVMAIKSFLSTTKDTYRKAYGRVTETFARQCIFIGTINPEGDGSYLRDVTGNRRFWPVQTGLISMENLRLDRDQLFAEAKHRFEEGEEFYLNTQYLNHHAAKEQLKRASSDPWTYIVERWVAKQEELMLPVSMLTTVRALQEVLGMSGHQINRPEQLRMANVLGTELGWRKKRIAIRGLMSKQTVYYNPDYDVVLHPEILDI